jgi:hypothetical protein
MVCLCCKQRLEFNGEMGRDGYTVSGARHYKSRKGYTCSSRCHDIQVAREIAEPLFPAPMRLVPP